MCRYLWSGLFVIVMVWIFVWHMSHCLSYSVVFYASVDVCSLIVCNFFLLLSTQVNTTIVKHCIINTRHVPLCVFLFCIIIMRFHFSLLLPVFVDTAELTATVSVS